MDPAADHPFTASLGERERALEGSLRPRALDDFVGQREVVANLRLALAAAKGRGEPLDHVLFSGLPGLGKTTLATLIATETGSTLHETAAPTLQRAADLAGLLTRLEPGDVLFIDEVHRLAPAVEEYLYAAMEDFRIDILLDQGPGARSVRIDLPRFTLVGATTREGLLSAPFRGRFGIHERLEPYAVDELTRIVLRSSGLLKVGMDEDAARFLAERARGTPRIANRFLRRVRDLAQVEAGNHVRLDVAREGLRRAGVDAQGLTRVDRTLLLALARAGSVALGLKSLCAAVGEDERTLEDVYEPHLLREGYVIKTPQGRRITTRGLHLVGAEAPIAHDAQGRLPL
jgi:Holliday junction DNA helicase RuvB